MRVVDRYKEAKEAVIAEGFAAEIDWQERVSFDDVQESDFLREGAWVILSSGMRESVIRRKFDALSAAFFRWSSARAILSRRRECRKRALGIFNHRGKIDAIIGLAHRVDQRGFEAVRASIVREGASYLESLAFIGPATSLHLAKNLGLDVVKPDRHLVRTSRAAGFGSPAKLCEAIARELGEKLSVIDLVIWRYATLKKDYVRHFTV